MAQGVSGRAPGGIPKEIYRQMWCYFQHPNTYFPGRGTAQSGQEASFLWVFFLLHFLDEGSRARSRGCSTLIAAGTAGGCHAPPLLAPWQEPRQLGRLLPAPPVSASLLLHTNPDTSSERDALSLEMECYDQGLSSGGEKESHRILEPAKSTYVFL